MSERTYKLVRRTDLGRYELLSLSTDGVVRCHAWVTELHIATVKEEPAWMPLIQAACVLGPDAVAAVIGTVYQYPGPRETNGGVPGAYA